METIKRHPLLSIIILAALLRLPTLGIESLWYDETFTVWLSNLPLSNLIIATSGDVHPPLWYIIEWVMVGLFGQGNIAMRLVSGLAGVVLVPAVYRLALAFEFDRRRALAAAMLAAVAPFMVYYSQEARAYSLIFLLTTLATIAVLERRYWLFIITATTALYLHNLVVLYIAALSWLSIYRRWSDWRMAASIAATGILWLPWLVFGLLGQISDVSSGFWVRTPTIGTPIFILHNWIFSPAAYMFVLATVPLLALACIQAIRRPDRVTVQLLGLSFIPMGLCIVIGAFTHPVLIDRVIASSAIPFYLLIAPSLTFPQGEQSKFVRYALPVMFAAVLAVFYTAYWGTNKIGRYDYDGNMAQFKKMANPATDGLYHANLATYIIEHYYLPEFEQVVWPQSNDLSQSLTDQTKKAMLMNQAKFEDIACNRARWWILYYENPTTSEGEDNEINRIINRYNGKLVDVIAKNKFVYSRVYLIEDACQRYAAQ